MPAGVSIITAGPRRLRPLPDRSGSEALLRWRLLHLRTPLVSQVHRWDAPTLSEFPSLHAAGSRFSFRRLVEVLVAPELPCPIAGLAECRYARSSRFRVAFRGLRCGCFLPLGCGWLPCAVCVWSLCLLLPGAVSGPGERARSGRLGSPS